MFLLNIQAYTWKQLLKFKLLWIFLKIKFTFLLRTIRKKWCKEHELVT